MKPAAPLLLIDVDGVISLFGFDQTEPPAGRFVRGRAPALHLRRAAGARLARLAGGLRVRLVHGLGGPRRRAPPAPARACPRGWAPPDASRRSPRPALHWKLAAIEAHAGPERPVAWIDDGHDASCERWAAERPGPDAAGRHRPGGRDHRRARRDAAQLGARSVRMTTSGGRRKRTGQPARAEARGDVEVAAALDRRGRARSARRSARARTAAAASGIADLAAVRVAGQRERDPRGHGREHVRDRGRAAAPGASSGTGISARSTRAPRIR